MPIENKVTFLTFFLDSIGKLSYYYHIEATNAETSNGSKEKDMQKIEFYQALVKKFNKLKAEWTEMSDKLNTLSGDEYEALNLKQIETWNEMVRVKSKADELNGVTYK